MPTSTTGAEPAIELTGVSRVYNGGSVVAVRELSLSVADGEAVALMGPSGSGKTTLLNLLAGLDRPSSGAVVVYGDRLDLMSQRGLTGFRARRVGVVFQDPHLLPGLSALENVVIGRLPYGARRELTSQARELLGQVGLANRGGHPPGRLSGGERQRVAIARALLGGPRLLLADEPTGNLDGATTERLLALLGRLRELMGLTLVIATHDPIVAAFADRVVRLRDGSVDRPGATNGTGAAT